MKKVLFLSVLALFGTLSAELPDSIVMQAQDIKVRLDRRKRWNINRIEWRGSLLCIDTPGAHYGMTCRPKGSPHFIGSGHTESGAGEEVISVRLFADGKEVAPGSEPVTGRSVGMEKVSSVYKFRVRYTFEIRDNIIAEKTEISSDAEVPLRQLYCSMHPWSTRFTDYHIIAADGKKRSGKFLTDGKHRNRAFAPLISWYDAKSGIIVSTAVEKPSWSGNLQRLLWDIRSYRKDYVCLVMNGVFPAKTTAVCRVRTTFSRQQDPGKWIADAEALCGKLQSSFAANDQTADKTERK
ncbi:MAG: hypothetical protein IJH79_17710 [Lentisphaeria bacterium]|nr:hypothetical protein [Lentisphaeria bacterium]